MVLAEIDSKGRVLIPKLIREEAVLEPLSEVNIFVKDSNHVIIEKIPKTKHAEEDSLDWLFKHPAHIDPKLATKEKLEEIEEEMWAS